MSLGHAQPRGAAFAAALGQPGVRPLFAAALLSRVGEQVFSLALVLYAFERTRSSEYAGLLVFLSIAPGLIASPVAGAILDRYGGMRAIRTDLALSSLAVALIVGAGAAVPHTPALPLLVAAYSLTSPLNLAGFRALVPRIVPERSLDAANALDTAIWSVVALVAPLLAGAAFAVAGGSVTLGVVAVLYAAAWLIMRTIGDVGSDRALRPTAAGNVLRDAVRGVVYVVRHPTLRGIAAGYSLYQASAGVLVVAVPAIVLASIDEQSGGTVVVGAIWAATGIAGGVTALAAGHLGVRGLERRAITMGIASIAPGLLLAAGALTLPTLLLALLVAGLASGPVDVAVLSLRQRRTDPGHLGRVLAVSISLNTIGAPIGSVIGGVAVAVSPQLALLLAAVLAGLGAAAGLLVPRDDHSPLSEAPFRSQR